MKYPPMASHWTIVQIPLQSSKGTAALGALQKLVWDSMVTCTGNVLLKFQNDTKMPIIVINTKNGLLHDFGEKNSGYINALPDLLILESHL